MAAGANVPRRPHPLRWRLEAAATHGLISALDLLPGSTSLRAGASLGRGFARFDSYTRGLAVANQDYMIEPTSLGLRDLPCGGG